MAAVHELLRQVNDPALRERLEQEIDRLTANKKFGLVFEEHLPECTPLYGAHIKRGSTVAKRTGKLNDIYIVLKIDGDNVLCRNRSGEMENLQTDEIVAIAEFGAPIFPTL
jgi:adenine-specific DNA-methyltransferase